MRTIKHVPFLEWVITLSCMQVLCINVLYLRSFPVNSSFKILPTLVHNRFSMLLNPINCRGFFIRTKISCSTRIHGSGTLHTYMHQVRVAWAKCLRVGFVNETIMCRLGEANPMRIATISFIQNHNICNST